MPERWLRACRRAVPEPWRSSVFDPTIADLRRAWLLERAGRSPQSPRLIDQLRLGLAVAGAALECRRLAAIARLVHASRPESRFAMIGSAIARASKIFVRQPALAVIVVVTLGVGIGANLTIFSVVNQVLLAPLPVSEPDRLVRVAAVNPGRDSDIVSFPDYRDLRDGSPSLDLAAHAQPTARVGDSDAGELRTVEVVTGNYFRVLGLRPRLGRLIEDRDDDVEGAHPVVVLGAGYWRSHYGGSDGVLGATLLINSTPFEIIGVAPEGYHGTYNAHQVDMWAPLTMQAQVRPRGQSIARRGWGWLSMIGRLKPGETLVSAQRDADRAAADLARRFPPPAGSAIGAPKFSVKAASPMSDADGRTFRPALAAAFAFTVLLLIVTCANLAGVMQARLVTCRRALAIQRSLGAGRGRLLVEWLAGSVVLALAGGVAGLVASQLAGVWLSSMKMPAALVADLTIGTRFDWRVIAYATGLSVVAGLLFGLIPAIRAGLVAPMSLLKDDGGAVVGGRAGTRVRRVMVMVQVAVSVVLLVASGLLAASLGNRRTFSPGFETGHLAVLQFDLRRQGILKDDWQTCSDQIVQRIRQHPGVLQADIATTVPLAPGQDRIGFTIPGYVSPTGKSNVSIDFSNVGPDYFQALGVSFARGGTWTRGAGAPSAVINETMAGRFWPGADPVGKVITVIDGPDVTIAGVVRDTAYYDIGETPRSYIFLPADTLPPPSFFVLIRTASDPASMVRDFARATTAMDRRLAPSLQMTYEDARAAPLFPMRMLAGASIAFGAIAMVLTAVGLYGVVSTMVGQRTKEIGVRMALGARSVGVLGGVLKDALVVAGGGAAAGLMASYWVAGQLGRWLFGVGRFDLTVYAVVAGITVSVALVAAAIPARRAAKVDPVVALRT